LVSSVSIFEKLFIGGNLNGHVGSTRIGFDGVHRNFGYESRNQEGEDILNFALGYGLMVANILFRKIFSHLVTFISGQHCSQIDFILARREDRHACLDCKVGREDMHTCLDYKVISGECVVPQHKLVVADFRFPVRLQRSKRIQALRTKWWKLKEETTKTFKERVIKYDPWHEGGDANSMWIKLTTCIRKEAFEEFVVIKRDKHETKETWWWNENVQKAIKEKKE
jgi:hypothetical protein